MIKSSLWGEDRNVMIVIAVVRMEVMVFAIKKREPFQMRSLVGHDVLEKRPNVLEQMMTQKGMGDLNEKISMLINLNDYKLTNRGSFYPVSFSLFLCRNALDVSIATVFRFGRLAERCFVLFMFQLRVVRRGVLASCWMLLA